MRKYIWLFALFLIPLVSGCGEVPDEVHTLTISPTSANLIVGGTQQFTATGKDEMGSPVSFTPGWTLSDSNVGSVSTVGLFTASAVGTTSVIASANSLTASALVTVTTGELYSIEISPSTLTISTTETQQFTAAGKNLSGGTVTISPSWEVLGAIGTISATGLFYPDSAGGGFVKATSLEVTGTASVSITQ